jgi:hypothetical protein
MAPCAGGQLDVGFAALGGAGSLRQSGGGRREHGQSERRD